MTIRPPALKRRQPAVGSLLIVTIVVPAISLKGAKNQLRRETGVPALPLSCGMDGEGKSRRWPNSGGCLSSPLQRKPRILSPGRPGQTMTPLTGRAAFSLALRLIPRLVDQDAWAQLRRPMDMIRQGLIDEVVPSLAAMVDDVVVGFEDSV